MIQIKAAAPPADIPYYKIFDLPKNGESHGRASGTEDYYSFTQGNIHFVCLDSMTSNTSPGSAMLTWVEDDLSRQDNPWIIAYWHHPPYSKGSHDSDTESRLIAMRQNVLPILERHGVDLVLGAHSNSYERSYLLDGHYGSSGTLSSSMVLDSGNGRVTGDGPYVKQQYVGNSGTVYATAGSSGKVESAPLNHPAMFIGLNNLGSMVIDINFNRLDAWFVKADGVVGDHFRLVKQNSPPVVSITQPTNGAEFDNVSQIVIKANVQDEGIRRVRFFAGTTHIDTVYEPPYEIVWPHPPVGTFRITARAEDKLMLSTTSAPVEITINSSH